MQFPRPLGQRRVQENRRQESGPQYPPISLPMQMFNRPPMYPQIAPQAAPQSAPQPAPPAVPQALPKAPPFQIAQRQLPNIEDIANQGAGIFQQQMMRQVATTASPPAQPPPEQDGGPPVNRNQGIRCDTMRSLNTTELEDGKAPRSGDNALQDIIGTAFHKVIIDTDGTSDDAFGILLALAAKEMEIIAITTVVGTTKVEQATANVFKTLKVFNMDTVNSNKNASFHDSL